MLGDARRDTVLGQHGPEGRHPPLLPAGLAQGPGPSQASEGGPRGGLPAGLGGAPCARPPACRATPASAQAVVLEPSDGGGPGDHPGPVQSARSLVGASRHPGGHRTSDRLDRILRGRSRSFDYGRHLHGSRAACRLHCRAWALLSNFAPWHRATTRKNKGWRSPIERLNQQRYHDCWRRNLLISASLRGYRCPLPQNP